MTTTVTKSSVALSEELEALNQQLAQAASVPGLIAAHNRQETEVTLTTERHAELAKKVDHLRCTLESDKASLSAAQSHLQATRCGIERLQAAADDYWGIVDGLDEAIRSLTFYVSNHAKKVKTRMARLQAAQKAEAAGAAAVKVATDALQTARKSLNEAKLAAAAVAAASPEAAAIESLD